MVILSDAQLDALEVRGYLDPGRRGDCADECDARCSRSGAIQNASTPRSLASAKTSNTSPNSATHGPIRRSRSAVNDEMLGPQHWHVTSVTVHRSGPHRAVLLLITQIAGSKASFRDLHHMTKGRFLGTMKNGGGGVPFLKVPPPVRQPPLILFGPWGGRGWYASADPPRGRLSLSAATGCS
jgi:hypothetical protein